MVGFGFFHTIFGDQQLKLLNQVLADASIKL